MKYRMENIIATLQRVPEPQYKGEQLSVPIMVASWERPITDETACMKAEKFIVLTAAEYKESNGNSWLEWMFDV